VNIPLQQIQQEVKRLLSRNNILKAPVPVFLIANNDGISIREAPTAANVSGALVRSGPAVFIAVNSVHHTNRQRFTVAHELAHYYLGHLNSDLHVDDDFTIKKRDERSSLAIDSNEIAANQFAAELLMPVDFIITDAAEIMPIDQEKARRLARKYQVSEQAMTIRLSNLGFLPPA